MTLTRIRHAGLATISLTLLVLVTFSWLIFPYAMDGTGMLFDTGSTVKDERREAHNALSQFLSRNIRLPGNTEVTVLFATPEYFEYADRSNAVELYRPDTHFVFFINEDTHTDALPLGLPEASLVVDGVAYAPVSVEGPQEVEHHRVTIARFAKTDATGAPIVTEDSTEIRLRLSHPWIAGDLEEDGVTPRAVTLGFPWELPLDIPEELRTRSFMDGAMLFSLSAGLLAAVLTPCLLQLAVVFLATLGGLGANEAASGEGLTPAVKRRIIVTATGFILGYVALFVAAGAVIGYAGKEAQIMFAEYTRAVGIGAGIVIIAFGLWLGIRSRAPVFCHLPGAGLADRLKGRSTFGSVFVAIAFSLGCMSCFGGAIIGTLFIYVGALGSATTGAAVMGMFAAGVAIPFLLAALFFSRMSALFETLQRHTRTVGLVSSVIVTGFGLLLVTDNFHALSDAIYPYLGLN